jgi:thymidine kinase
MIDENPHIELVLGTMWSGKTTELLRRSRVYEAAGLKAQLFKPAIDDRYGLDKITSHDGQSRSALYVKNVDELISCLWNNTDVIVIEEAQFFEKGLAKICDSFVNVKGKSIIAGGLHRDTNRNPWPTITALESIADYITHLKAVCQYKFIDEDKPCGKAASDVIALTNLTPKYEGEPIVAVGGAESYSPRCRKHYHQYQSQQ